MPPPDGPVACRYHVDGHSEGEWIRRFAAYLEGDGRFVAAPLDGAELVVCTWRRHADLVATRERRKLGFRLSQIPHASQKLHAKERFLRRFRRQTAVPKAYLEAAPRRLRGIWVEKPLDSDQGRGIRFLRDPKGWRKPGHLLQRYVEDVFLVDGHKTELRVLVRLNDDATWRMSADALIRSAHLPYSLDDLDPLRHNANAAFQAREGVREGPSHLLSEFDAHRSAMASIGRVIDAHVRRLRREGSFRGTQDFELLGYDFLLDRAGRVHVLEANRFPGLYFHDAPRRRFYGEALARLLP